MAQEFNFFFSNHLTVLYENLKNKLFNPASKPFARRLIIVYGPVMKSWLTMRMAEDPDLGVSAGIEVIYLNEAFEKLLQECEREGISSIPSSMEVAFAIEQEILTILKTFHLFNVQEQLMWKTLIHYLKLDPSLSHKSLKLTRKIEKRITGLSLCLANCFQEYGRYAGAMTSLWEEQKQSHEWQQVIWNKLFGSKSQWTYPYKVFQQVDSFKNNLEIHFFSISYVSRIEFLFLHKMAQTTPVTYYLLSPCAVFWSDIRSDRESAFLRTFWHQKLGTGSSQVTQLEELLRDRNPLLANFGRLGREMALLIDESAASAQAHYIVPFYGQQFEENSFSNEDIYFIEKDNPLTLLEAIQSDILLMRNPQEQSQRSIEKGDVSVQIHIVPTKRREIEILYNNLLQIIQKNPSICPKDISVMAPNILEYMPYIQSIFGSKESLLDYQILDIDLRNQSEIARSFIQLIDMTESRWDSFELLQLFEHSCFQRRQKMTQADYSLIRQWIDVSGIRWGHTLEHRNELLTRRHCENGMADETESGTWDHGINRLLIALTTTMKQKHDMHADIFPCENIDFSQGELLEKWIRLLHALRDDLSLFNDQSYLTLADWSNYLHCLLESYFQPDFNDSNSMAEYEQLKEKIDILRKASYAFKDEKFSFIAVKTHLNNILNQKSVAFHENRAQTVRFCSMVPLRSVPSTVIALLGMQEGNFPRNSAESALNLANNRQKDYAPNSVDYDRYLFLEAIQSAQHTLLISYQGYSNQDGKELQPSLVIEELISYLNRYYSFHNESFSDCCVFRHPFDAFNKAYFQKESRFHNFSIQDYKSAQAYYNKQKQHSHAFLDRFALIYNPQVDSLPDETVIHIRQLTEVASNPIKFYLNRSLDMYLQKEESCQLYKQEQWTLSPLDKHIMKRSSVKESVESVLSRAKQEGKLPLGMFKTVAMKKFSEEAVDVQERLSKHEITSDEIFHIEFCTSCSEPTQVDKDAWIFPAVCIDYPNNKRVRIIGKLPHVSAKGLISLSKATLPDVWKMWPQFLLYQHAAQLRKDVLDNRLIFIYHSKSKQAFFDDPQPLFKQFINYYSLCRTQFSPLIPEWIPLILEGKAEELENKMRQLFDSYSFGNEYQHSDLQWLLNKNRLPCSRELIHEWKGHAQILLGDIMTHWYGLKENSQSGEI